MEPSIDHVAIPAHDAAGGPAHWLAHILGVSRVETDGADDDLFNVVLDGSGLLFSDAEVVASHHLAFRVEAADFDAIVGRLRAGGIAFGNDPEDPANGLTSDPLGGGGRAYFISPDQHLFEITFG